MNDRVKEQFHDLSFEVLEGGTIRLEQRDHSGESVILDAHPQQIIHIARTVSAARRTQPNGTAERIATLERRLIWLRDRFEETRVAAPADMYDRCPEAFEFDAWIQASIDVATEFCADLVGMAVPVVDSMTEINRE